jgi:hypothetical protein
MLEVLRNTQQGKNIVFGPGGYLLQEVLITGLLAWVWIIGLVWLLANAYPYLTAAGSVAIERWTSGSRVVRVAVATAVVVLGLATAPLVMPVLPEAQLARYQDRLFSLLHIPRGSIATEHQAEPELPGDFADMHGWPELAATVANVYQSLPPEERAEAVIVAQNYGEAGAIEFFGRSARLPVISGHNQYFLWAAGL